MNNSKRDIHQYDDIINMPHHTSTYHTPMPIGDRAAQFSPFAALSGYDDAISEAARLTDCKKELSENDLTVLDSKLHIIMDKIKEQPEIIITYFKYDNNKSGGSYISVKDNIKKIDKYNCVLIMLKGTIIPIKDISDIDGEIFDF